MDAVAVSLEGLGWKRVEVSKRPTACRAHGWVGRRKEAGEIFGVSPSFRLAPFILTPTHAM
jgi:hypothetical protein